MRDPDVYANLGLADAHAGHLGPAILSFERALRLRPGDGETEAALGIARAAVGKRRADKQGEALVETRPPLAEALVRPYREDTLAWLALVLDASLVWAADRAAACAYRQLCAPVSPSRRPSRASAARWRPRAVRSNEAETAKVSPPSCYAKAPICAKRPTRTRQHARACTRGRQRPGARARDGGFVRVRTPQRERRMDGN